MPAPVPVRLSSVLLDLAAAFTDTSVPTAAAPLLAQLDASGLTVHGYRIVESADGRIVQLRLPPGGAPRVLIAIPAVTAFDLVAEFGDAAILEVAEPGPHTRFAEVRGLRLAVRFDPGLLRPLDGSARAELSWTGSLRCYRDWRVALVGDPELSLSPCEITGTGIVLELEGVQLDLTTDASPIRARGLDAGFPGVYARAGSLRLLPQARFGGFDGIRVDVRDLAIGSNGVTGRVGRYYTLERTAEGRLDPANPLNGDLLDGAWQIGIGVVEVSLRNSVVTQFLIEGLVRIPIFDALLSVRFGLRKAGVGHETTLRIGSSTPITVAIGGGRLDIASFALEGTFAGPGGIAVSGVLSEIDITLAPIRISAARIGVALRHGPGGDELRLELSDVPLGPLGTLDVAELIVTEERDNGSASRHVRLEGTVAWSDLRGRLDLPAAIPEPSGGRARVVLSWDEDATGTSRLVVRLSTQVDDLSGLLSFVPADYRPRIEHADLDIEIVYPSAAAFSAASASEPLSGSASISATILLPMLPTLPGVLAVATGDADGRVRAILGTTLGTEGQQVSFALTDPVSLDLTLPGLPAGAPVITLGLTSVTVSGGVGAGRSTFSLAGVVSVPAMDDYLTRLVDRLGLPPELAGFLEPLAWAMPGSGTFALDIEFDGATAVPSIELTFSSSNPPAFQLLEELGKVVNPDATAAGDATPLPGLGVPQDFFAVSPKELRLFATLADPPTFRLSGSLDTTVFGETFDMTLSITVEPADFRIALTAGATDPILITAPIPDPTALLGGADVSAVAAMYGLDSDERANLVRIEQFLTDLAAELGPQGVLAFEISDLSVGLTPQGPVVSGQARLVQLPRVVDVLTPLTELRIELGAETDKVFVTIEREGGDSQLPLLTVPAPGDVDIDVYFRSFMLAYAWGRNEFAFALDAAIHPSQPLELTVGGSGVLLPAVDADIQLGATATVPPAPLPEGILSFVRQQQRASDRAVHDLGLQAVIGAVAGSRHSRFVTAYVRELAFSPTYFLLWPGFRGDGGLVLGGPDPRELTSAAYFDVKTWDRGSFFARFTVQRGTLVFLDPMLGVMLNPLAAVPPFITANPPYWIAPPLIMGDLYADEIGVSVNLPGLAFFDLTFERPLPSFSLQALLELAALAAGGFTHPIPATSPLRGVFFARLRVILEVNVLGVSEAGASASVIVEVNVADLINGAIDLMHKATATLQAGSDLIGEVSRDPAALVRMIPRDARRLDHDIKLGGFDFSGSLYLLTPDELRDELVLFFENKRRRDRGIAANRAQPPPTATLPVNQRPVWQETEPITWQGMGDVRSLLPDMASVGRKATAVAVAAHQARAASLDKLQRDRQRNHDESADALARALAAIPSHDSLARKAALNDLGMSELVARVEAVLAPPRRPARPGGGRTIEEVLRVVIAEAMSVRDDAMIADSALAAPPEEVAAELVRRIVGRPALPEARPGAPGRVARPQILPAADRTREIERLVPDRSLRGRRAIIDAFGVLERRLSTIDPATNAGELAIGDTTRAIVNDLVKEFGVRHERFTALLGERVDPAALGASIRTGVLTTWPTLPRLAMRTVDVGTFDGKHFAGVLRGLEGFRPRPPSHSDTVEVVAGYRIQTRDGGFAVPVPSAGAMYKVVRRDGSYRLLVRTKDRQWSVHDLPAALVNAIPEGPGKADLLRDELTLQPHTTRRPRTQAEKDATTEQFEHSDTLYQTSILARPEYQVKASGGVHGPFFLADLLRDPVSGLYTVPAEPVFLGGFRTSLFGSEIRLGGMVVGGQPRPSAFLYGHTVLNASVGAFQIRATGNFVASSGPLWQTIPLPSGEASTGDVIGFTGHVVVRVNGRKLFEGGADGEFTRAANGAVSAALTVRVRSEGFVDLEVADTEFARIAWSFDGDLKVQLTPQTFSVSANATAAVSVDVATYETRWVVDVPATTTCIPFYFVDSLLPPRGHWGSLCTRTPEVSHPEIDFSTVTWNRLPGADCALLASASTNSVAFALDLSPLSDQILSGIGISTLELPDLV